MRTRTLVLSSIMGLALVGSPLAADLPVKAPPRVAPVVAAYNWTGFYIGGHAGYAWGDFKIDNLGVAQNYSFSVDSFVGGGQAGANWQFNSFVLGLEVDVSSKRLTGDDGGFLGVFDEIKGRWGGTFRGRAGVAADRWLLYVTGGLAWLNYTYNDTILPAGPGVTFTKTDTGWTVGGGIEVGLSPNWSAKVEYLYADYGDQTRTAAFFASPWVTTLTTSEVRFGINYRFGPVVARY